MELYFRISPGRIITNKIFHLIKLEMNSKCLHPACNKIQHCKLNIFAKNRNENIYHLKFLFRFSKVSVDQTVLRRSQVLIPVCIYQHKLQISSQACDIKKIKKILKYNVMGENNYIQHICLIAILKLG